MGSSAAWVEEFLKAVETAGARYGLSLHHDEFQLLQIRTGGAVHKPDGGAVEAKSSMIYLGSLVHDSGRCTLEISRRIGMCKGIFRKLSRFWIHCNVGLMRKLEVFQSLLVSKLVYGLSAVWLGLAEQRRVDAFQNYCLRRILRIPSAYVSRVSNAEVLRKSGHIGN